MTDKKHEQLVQDFANDHSVTIGGGIKVSYTIGHTSYTPVGNGMKHEDVNYLHDQIRCACAFLFWLRRQGYDIVKRRKK